MSETNTALWQQVYVTDPTAVKPITGKQYRGNSPKPYWIIQRATEVFGPCGIAWGVEVVNERFERFGEVESLHVALIRVWYEYQGKRGVVEQMGQTRSSYVTSAGKFMVDEDAPKKSVTDGMVKCLSMLGFAGDIFSGQWDDSKYVAFAAEETKRRQNGDAPKHSPRGDIGVDLPDDWKNYLGEMAVTITAMVADGAVEAALEKVRAEKLEDDQHTYLWSQLDSKTRAAMKAKK